MPKDLLTRLNAQQRAAAKYGVTEGNTKLSRPLLIIAGPGTGKTNTLAYRVSYLTVHGADPSRILLLVFGRHAAREMQDRTNRILSKAGLGDREISWAGTFHSIGTRLLRSYGYRLGVKPNFGICDNADAVTLMGMVRSLPDRAGTKSALPSADECWAIHSRSINDQKSLVQVLNSRYPQYSNSLSALTELFAAFAKAKQDQNLVDFDDLLGFWLDLMKDDEAGSEIRSLFDYVFVDEFQDTNSLQAKILRKLKPDGRGLTVVGDDDQTIYSFRGAKVRNIIRFPKYFGPKAKIIKLEQNYRSTRPILDACNSVAGCDPARISKTLWSKITSSKKPKLITVNDSAAQAAYVANEIENSRKAGVPFSEQAVLFRISAHSTEIEEELLRRNIPFLKYGGTSFFELPHVKDLIAVLRWCENPEDQIAGSRSLRLLPGIGQNHANRILVSLSGRLDRKSLSAIVVPSKTRSEWQVLESLILALRSKGQHWDADIETVRTWYKRRSGGDTRRKHKKAADFDRLSVVGQRYSSRSEFLTAITLDIRDNESAGSDVTQDRVLLSTMHSAKGHEWRIVRIINAVDGQIPSAHAIKKAARREERRLFYVAMSRAKEQLEIIIPRRVFVQGPGGRGQLHVLLNRTPFIPDSILSCFQSSTIKRT